jgi:hypothetical protein
MLGTVLVFWDDCLEGPLGSLQAWSKILLSIHLVTFNVLIIFEAVLIVCGRFWDILGATFIY